MAFGDFVFPDVEQVLGLQLSQADLFGSVAAVPLRAAFQEMLAEGVPLALAINTEKARSEFIIAPVLLELRHQLKQGFSLFSGVELNVDRDRGLNGVCDFILAKSPIALVLRAPVVTIVEAKNDNIHNGLGQCIASMYAAWLFNQQAQTPIPTVYGVVTTGTNWKYLQLRGAMVTIDEGEYYVDNLGKILGIFQHILQNT
jgi:hypothetical protein